MVCKVDGNLQVDSRDWSMYSCLLNLNPVWTSVKISLHYFNNFNHPQRDQPISFCMKYVITVLNISAGLREPNNCSLGGDFQVPQHEEICQFDGFYLEINLESARSCNYENPRLDSS